MQNVGLLPDAGDWGINLRRYVIVWQTLCEDTN